MSDNKELEKLRDDLAGRAMQAIYERLGAITLEDCQYISTKAYEMADAMIAARGAGNDR